MTANIFVLAANGRLGKYKNRIMRIAKESVKLIGKKIPLPDVDIVFYDNPKSKYIIPHLGLGGYAHNAHLVVMPLNPDFNHFERMISEEIKRTLSHELHHCARMKALGYGDTLLKAMVSEGLADHFGLEITNKKPQKWDTALIVGSLRVMKKRALRELNNKKYNHWDWFIGSKARKIPKWTGYTLGFELVKDYLKKHPDKKPSQLFAIKAEEFVKK